MTAPDQPTLDDVLPTTEEAHPDRREHAKEPHPADDADLERRAEQERRQSGAGGPVET